MTYVETDDFVITKDWRGIKELSLYSRFNYTFTYIYCLVQYSLFTCVIACLILTCTDTF